MRLGPPHRPGAVTPAALACAFALTACTVSPMPRDLGRAAPRIGPPPAAADLAAPEGEPVEGGYREVQPGLLARPVFTGPEREAAAAEAAGAGLGVEVRDLLVGPGRSSSGFALDDAGGVFEVRSGSGVASIDGERMEITTGTTFAVSAGGTLDLENTGDSALVIRVFVIGGR